MRPGGRFDSRGGNETPDTLTAVYEFDKLVMTFELTLYTPYMLKVSPTVRNGETFPYWPQCGTRIEIYGSEGVMLIGPHGGGWQVFARPRREQPSLVDRAYGQPPDLPHQENFVQCLRSRKPPTADVERGAPQRPAGPLRQHQLPHAAARSCASTPQSDEIVDNPAAMALFRRTYRKPWVVEG